MHQVVSRDIEMQQFLMALFTAFAAAAMALAGVGVYGMTAYNVEQRTREIGIRMALGATRGLVLRSFVTEGIVVALGGLVIGIIGARFTTDGLSTMIFGLTPHDPMTLLTVSAVLLGIAVMATLLPSLRAAKTNPALAMRAE
jgi:ABC-type antimicrobial peptide transport system permease subunit